jgi:hypothetical protein
MRAISVPPSHEKAAAGVNHGHPGTTKVAKITQITQVRRSQRSRRRCWLCQCTVDGRLQGVFKYDVRARTTEPQHKSDRIARAAENQLATPASQRQGDRLEDFQAGAAHVIHSVQVDDQTGAAVGRGETLHQRAAKRTG